MSDKRGGGGGDQKGECQELSEPCSSRQQPPESTNGAPEEGTKPPTKKGGPPERTCCFCWCCCCSCSCLSVKNNLRGKTKSSQTDHQLNGEPPAPLEEIRKWGESFDKLMKCPAGRKVFREFLRCEYSEENILFWMACEDLKNEQNPDVIEEKARLIYEDYISILSPKEVSLDSQVRDAINRNMIQPTSHTFDEAQMQIYTLMHRDSYPRFLNSALYRRLAQLPSPTPRKASAASSTATAPQAV